MSPAVSWLLVTVVVAGFALLAWQIIAWIDQLLDWRWERRYLRRRP